MIKNREAVVKAHRAIRQLEVVHCAGAQARFDKVFQVVPPIPETTAQWKRQIDLINQLIPRQQLLKHIPRISVLYGGTSLRVRDANLTTAAPIAQRQKRPRHHKRIARLIRRLAVTAQQHQTGHTAQLLRQSLRRMARAGMLDQGTH